MPASLRVLGTGPAVLLVHGSVGPGPTWKAQEPLAARWRLVIVTRRGFRTSSPAAPQDHAADAADLERLLYREASHCVGFGFGAAGVALAAGRSPGLFRSIVLIEPPAAPAPDPEGGSATPLPDLAAIAAAGLPALVLTGDHDPQVEATGDAWARAMGAERERLPGAGPAVPRAPQFNGRLERFLFAAESSRE